MLRNSLMFNNALPDLTYKGHIELQMLFSMENNVTNLCLCGINQQESKQITQPYFLLKIGKCKAP